MWPFKLAGVIKGMFERFMDKELVDVIVSGTEELHEMRIDYVLLLLSNHKAIGKAISIINSHDCMIESITGTLITVLIGAPIPNPKSDQIREQLVDHVAAKLASEAVVLHGGCSCPVGTVGNEQRKSYTAIIPEYKTKLRQLATAEFGEVVEA